MFFWIPHPKRCSPLKRAIDRSSGTDLHSVAQLRAPEADRSVRSRAAAERTIDEIPSSESVRMPGLLSAVRRITPEQVSLNKNLKAFLKQFGEGAERILVGGRY